MFLFLVYNPKEPSHWSKETMNENDFRSIFMGENKLEAKLVPTSRGMAKYYMVSA